ncbi:ATP-dependent DNA ligase [Ectothiorhodospiraceae bacterium WFHF3C12]|nr:ATP-dependent DNA ligase [Ectothiorhodospiraceae bacterium WFHF3C12]
MSVLQFGPYRVDITNTDKLLFPDSGITKGELIQYYRRVSDWMLPHLRQRPLALRRFPDGIAEEGFFQQRPSGFFPAWIATVAAPRASGGAEADAVEHVLCNNRATLAYLANQAAISLHGWLSRAPAINVPDRLVFDLDPSDDDFGAVRDAARAVVALMHHLGMNPYVMTTGSRGLHVVAPLRRETGFDEVRALAREMAARLVAHYPDELTVEQRKDQRGGRVYLDVMRNAYGQTTVLPYSVRARPGAPVAMPIDLAELDRRTLGPQDWHLGNAHRRLEKHGDPWAGLRRHATSARKAGRALAKLQDSET